MFITRRLDKSHWPRSGAPEGLVNALMSALAMVGTTAMLVALCSSMSRNTSDGSNRRTMTCLMPSMVEACGCPHPLA